MCIFLASLTLSQLLREEEIASRRCMLSFLSWKHRSLHPQLYSVYYHLYIGLLIYLTPRYDENVFHIVASIGVTMLCKWASITAAFAGESISDGTCSCLMKRRLVFLLLLAVSEAMSGIILRFVCHDAFMDMFWACYVEFPEEYLFSLDECSGCEWFHKYLMQNSWFESDWIAFYNKIGRYNFVI